MLLKIRGFHTVAVNTAGRLAVILTALRAEAAILAELLAECFHAGTALRAEPVVVVAAVCAMVAAVLAPDDFRVFAEALITERAMRGSDRIVVAEVALIADIFIAAADCALLAMAEGNQHIFVLQTRRTKRTAFTIEGIRAVIADIDILVTVIAEQAVVCAILTDPEGFSVCHVHLCAGVFAVIITEAFFAGIAPGIVLVATEAALGVAFSAGHDIFVQTAAAEMAMLFRDAFNAVMSAVG